MKHILVMDDDPVILEFLTRLLERTSYKVSVATDGKEGLKLFRQDGADLLIVDIFMPKMDGLRVIRQLKEETPDLKIIAISGGQPLMNKDVLVTAQKLGVRHTLKKPFLVDELLQAIAELEL